MTKGERMSIKQFLIVIGIIPISAMAFKPGGSDYFTGGGYPHTHRTITLAGISTISMPLIPNHINMEVLKQLIPKTDMYAITHQKTIMEQTISLMSLLMTEEVLSK